MRHEAVVMQEHDYSCGAAALATLMSYYFDDPISEKTLLDFAQEIADIDPRELETKGLSLLNLKQLAEARGYRAMGIKLSSEQLGQLTGPILIHYRPKGYEHFAVFKGIKNGRVYIADPIHGNVRMSLEAFTADWEGTALALDKEGRINTASPLVIPQGPAQPELNILRNMR